MRLFWATTGNTLAEANPSLLGAGLSVGRIVGWKLEFDGDRADTIVETEKTDRENHTDACIVNVPAFGTGFGFCQTKGLTHLAATRQELADFLLQFAESLPVRRRVRSEK